MAGKPKVEPEQVVAALRQCEGRVYQTAEMLGVSVRTVERYAQKNGAVKDCLEHQKGKLIDGAESSLWKAVKEGKGWAVCFARKCWGQRRGGIERLQAEEVDDGELNREIERLVEELAKRRQGKAAGTTPPADGRG